MDLILAVVALLRRDMDGLARVVWEALELVELWDGVAELYNELRGT
jgi:hypothetical protein